MSTGKTERKEAINMKDGRYSVTLEFCGQPRKRWVVRFCGEWIGTAKNRVDAEKIRQAHAAARGEIGLLL
jgi:hypothetical protein